MSRKDQHKVGTPETPRGQQTGFAGHPSQNREAMKDTPSLRGRRKDANEFFADDSAQHASADAATPNSNSPSLPAVVPTDVRKGETGGERAFKKRQSRKRKTGK